MHGMGLFCALAVVASSTLFTSGAPAAGEDDLIAAGETVFVKCKTCHLVGPPTKFKKTPPHLNDLFGRKPLLQELDSFRAVSDVDVRLRGDDADAGFTPAHHGTDREIAGLDRAAEGLRLRIVRDDRERRDDVFSRCR